MFVNDAQRGYGLFIEWMLEESESDMYITLATRRDTVNFINEKKLADLPGESAILEGEIKGEFPENSLPTQMELELKPGAQIIFIKNDPDKRWVNGTIGTVSGIDENAIDAAYTNGILTLTLPKKERQQLESKRIEIK